MPLAGAIEETPRSFRDQRGHGSLEMFCFLRNTLKLLGELCDQTCHYLGRNKFILKNTHVLSPPNETSKEARKWPIVFYRCFILPIFKLVFKTASQWVRVCFKNWWTINHTCEPHRSKSLTNVGQFQPLAYTKHTCWGLPTPFWGHYSTLKVYHGEAATKEFSF